LEAGEDELRNGSGAALHPAEAMVAEIEEFLRELFSGDAVVGVVWLEGIGPL